MKNVFVSHSTKEAPTGEREFLTDLVARLKSCHHEGQSLFCVSVDHELIESGDHWRRKLFQQLGECDCGIVVLNKRAMSSDWVDTETRIMAWRSWIEPGFTVIPILVGDGADKTLASLETWDSVLKLKEIQFLSTIPFAAKAMPNDAFEELAARLGRCASTRTQLHRFRRGLNARLKEALRGEIPKSVDLDFFDKGLEGFEELEKRYSEVIDSQQIGKVIDWLAPWWMEPLSTAPLQESWSQGDKKPAPKAFAVTSCFPARTLQWKTVQASVREKGWKVGIVPAKDFPVDRDKLKEDVIEEARQALREVEPRWKTLDDGELAKRISSQGMPVFVALPPAYAGNAELAESLMEKLNVSVFCLQETKDETRQIAKECSYDYVLEPLLDPKKEKETISLYDRVLSWY